MSGDRRRSRHHIWLRQCRKFQSAVQEVSKESKQRNTPAPKMMSTIRNCRSQRPLNNPLSPTWDFASCYSRYPSSDESRFHEPCNPVLSLCVPQVQGPPRLIDRLHWKIVTVPFDGLLYGLLWQAVCASITEQFLGSALFSPLQKYYRAFCWRRWRSRPIGGIDHVFDVWNDPTIVTLYSIAK